MYYNDNVNNGTSISDLYIKAIMYNEERQRRDGAALLTRLRAQSDSMSLARGRVTGLLTTYYTTARSYTGDILRTIFSTPQGAGTDFPAGKIDECSRRLGLSQQESLLDKAHPLCREYPSAPAASFEYFHLKESVQRKYCPSNKTRIQKQQSSSLLLVSSRPLCCAKHLVACAGLCSAVGRPHRELEVGRRRVG